MEFLVHTAVLLRKAGINRSAMKAAATKKRQLDNATRMNPAAAQFGAAAASVIEILYFL
jgi:hypothetical protein